jgi:hypothetical protein
VQEQEEWWYLKQFVKIAMILGVISSASTCVSLSDRYGILGIFLGLAFRASTTVLLLTFLPNLLPHVR